MDLKPQSQQPISDDQELAKVLAGVTEEADQSAEAGSGTTPVDNVALPPLPQPTPMPAPVAPAPVAEPVAMPSFTPVMPPVGDDLDSVKKEAIGELRPLVGKLNVSPEEKFDTYLLLIRSTDDKSLIAPAHEAAKAIEDETKRADALLNIIKEIDYLSGSKEA
jgi:hypothetical protein